MTQRLSALRPARPGLIGNRLVLVGAVLYLLEWVAIIPSHLDAPLGAGTSVPTVVRTYAGHPDLWAWAAGWFSVVLLGRILLISGLRQALLESGRSSPLLVTAVAAMTVSVALEIATYAVVAGAAWSLAHGGGHSSVPVLDAAAFELNQMLYGPLGIAVLLTAGAMWASGLFSRVLSGIGLLSGVLATLAALVASGPNLAGLFAAANIAVPLFWVWMLWAGVVCWRAAPREASENSAVPRG